MKQRDTAAQAFMRQLGQRIRRRREALGWSQDAAAMALGVHPSAWGLYERGARMPPLPQFMKLAEVLSVTAESLAGIRYPWLKTVGAGTPVTKCRPPLA